VIRLLPALSISRKEVDEFLSALKASIQELNNQKTVEVSNESLGVAVPKP
jgi:hypothetical protein